MKTKIINNNLKKFIILILVIASVMSIICASMVYVNQKSVGYAEDVSGQSEENANNVVLSKSGKVKSVLDQNSAVSAGYTWVTTETELRNAIRNNLMICLGADITLNASYQNSSGNLTTTVYTRVFDGNGKKVSIDAQENLVSNGNLHTSAGSITVGSATYNAYSYFIPINSGTIKNLTIDYTSNHNFNNATQTDGRGIETSNSSATGSFCASAGILTGINYGTIDNVRVNVKGMFALAHYSSGNELTNNTVYAGAISGMVMGGSRIANSTVDLEYTAQKAISVVLWRTASGGYHQPVVGGFVGNISEFDATDTNKQVFFDSNILLGNGDVYAGTASTAGSIYGNAAGYVGASILVTSTTAYSSYALIITANANKVFDGFITSWRGDAISSRGSGVNTNVEMHYGAILFDYVGNSIKDLYIGYDYTQTYLNNTANGGSEAVNITEWYEAYTTQSGQGTVSIAFDEYDQSVSKVKIGAIAGGAYDVLADFNTTNSDGTTKKTYDNFMDFSMRAKAIRQVIKYDNTVMKARIIYAAKLSTLTNSNSIVCDASETAGSFFYRFNSTEISAGSLVIDFGELITYKFVNTSDATITSSSVNYNGNTIEIPNITFESGFNTGLTDITKEKLKFSVTRTPLDSSTQEIISDMSVTYKTGIYEIYPSDVYNFTTDTAGTETGTKIAYCDPERRLIAKINPSNNFKYTIEALDLNTTLQSSSTWVASAEIKVESNMAFTELDPYREDVKQNTLTFARPGVIEYQYTTDVETGISGAKYRFSAYIDSGDGRYLIAKTPRNQAKNLTVYIDKSKPIFEYEEIRMFDDGQLNSYGREPITYTSNNTNYDYNNGWYNKAIVVKHIVGDEGRSGISYYGINGAEIVGTEETNNLLTAIYVKVTNNKSYTISLTDSIGNMEEETFSYNVDTVIPFLDTAVIILDTQTQNLQGEDNEYHDFIVSGASYIELSFSANTRNRPSGWTGYYKLVDPEAIPSSYGDDNWIESSVLTDAITTAMFVDFYLNFEIQGKAIVIKYVNQQGIYEDIISSKFLANGGTPLYVKPYYATLYYKTSEIFIKEGANEEKPLSDYQKTDLVRIFTREYDGTTNIAANIVLSFINPLNVNRIESISSESYLTMDNFEIIAQYSSKDAGSEKSLKIWLQGKTELGYDKLFNVLIIDEGDIKLEFPDSAPARYEKAVSEIEVVTEIQKKTILYNVSDPTNNITITYGEEIPQGKEISITLSGIIEKVYLTYKSDVTNRTAVGTDYEYRIDETLLDSNYKMQYNAGEDVGKISITQKDVMISVVKVDGEKELTSFMPTTSYNAQEHILKAYYFDLDGNKVYCTSEIKIDTTPATEMRNVAVYNVTFGIGDANYKIADYSENKVTSFTITKATIEIDTSVQTVRYSGLAREYNIIRTPEEAEGTVTIKYYPMKVTLDSYGNIVASVIESTSIDKSLVVNTGYYKVVIEFVPTDTQNYIEKRYDDSMLVILKAITRFKTEDYVETFTNEEYTMKIKDGTVARYITLQYLDDAGHPQDYKHASAEENDIKIEYFENGEEEGVVGKTFSQAGTYTYTISFAGNDNFEAVTSHINLVINKAKLDQSKIKFNDATYVYEKGNSYSVAVELSEVYKNATVRYRIAGMLASQEKPIERENANEYTITAIISMDNYEDLTLTAKLTIKTADFRNIYAENVDVVYDGELHKVLLKGTEKYIDEGVSLQITEVNVEQSEAGEYYGSYLIVASNHTPLTIETYLRISAMEVEVNYDTVLESSITTATDITKIFVNYTDPFTNETVSCNLKVYDADGNEIDTTTNPKLKAGTYTAYIAIQGGNYTPNSSSASISFEVAQANPMTTILVVGGSAVVVVVLVVIIIVFAMKAKKNKKGKTKV